TDAVCVSVFLSLGLLGFRFFSFFSRAFCLAYRQFQRLLEEQDFFASNARALPASGDFPDSAAPQFHYQKLLNYLPDLSDSSSAHSRPWKGNAKNERRDGRGGGVFAAAKPHMSAWVEKRLREKSGFSSEELFNELCAVSGCPRPRDFSGRVEDVKQIPSFVKEIVLAYSYPRLDINVSKDIGHLLKSPFCRVCVPLEVAPERTRGASASSRFDPARVPTLTLLRRQFDDPSRAHLPPHQRTSLAPYLDFFRETFLYTLLKNVAEETKYVKKLLEGVDARIKPEVCF
ncbi:putative small subunit DNA primase, partial [Toxoplasma gondii TgCatPRC2]